MSENNIYQNILEKIYGKVPYIKCLVLVNIEGEILATKMEHNEYGVETIGTVSSSIFKLLETILQDWQKKKISKFITRNDSKVVILQQISENLIFVALGDTYKNSSEILSDIENLIQQIVLKE